MSKARDIISRRGAAVVRTLALDADELLRALLNLDPSRGVQILDSGGVRGDDARYLIAGFDPLVTVEARGRELHIRTRDRAAISVEHRSVLALLDEWLAQYRQRPDTTTTTTAAAPPRLPATAACFVTFSYDLARRFERLRTAAAPATGDVEPDATLAFCDALVIHDYARGETFITSIAGTQRLDETCRTLDEARRAAATATLRQPPDAPERPLATSNFSRAEYLSMVTRIKRHIYAGDIYQANLTQQLTCPLARGATPEKIFMRLHREHPASFAAFIRRREDTVLSVSPERFLRVEAATDDDLERCVEAWPIKGTRARGTDAGADARLRAELLASEKDRAENVMIVDLLRNDLGRVCSYGSVEVAQLCAIQEHPTLFHLVSKVRGRLRREVTAGDLVRAAFPCGSITGAPKIRAMEIIDEVETARRGLSMGAIGYFAFDGALDLSVAIRTMTIRDRRARFNVGGGIVADSDPALEYEESLVKARALLDALEAVEVQDGQPDAQLLNAGDAAT